MKTIYQGDSLVQKVIGKKAIESDTLFRWSHYAVFHSCDGKEYLYHTFTKQLLFLEGETPDKKTEVAFSAAEVSADSVLSQLARDSFLVPEDKDEASVYESYCKLARAMKPRGYNKYTILPTTACNARCVYCYEAGIPFVSMSDETVEQTIAFIKNNRDPKRPVRFCWFGGEPLMGEKNIDKIVDALTADGIGVSSSMISNGSLITSDIVKKMREQWNLKRIQITLDGTEKQYNARKNYVFHYDSAYWHVLSRIKLINENGINLVIRINVDHENVDGIPTMLEDLKNFLPNPSLVMFNIAPLYDLQMGANPAEIWNKSFVFEDMIRAAGFGVAYHYKVSKPKTNFCMADSPYNALVVAPDGKLYLCEHVQEVESVGDIWNGVTRRDLIQKAASVEPAREECKTCFALPNCTTFTGCPNHKQDCADTMCRRMERALDSFIRSYNASSAAAAEAELEENDEDC